MNTSDQLTKDDIRWMLHWPRRNQTIDDELLAKYPDMQKVAEQINIVSDSITIQDDHATIDTGIEQKTFNLKDFPMSDRIAQREFVRQTGLGHKGIEDVSIGKKSWEVFDAKEVGVIGIQKKLMTVLDDEHNHYILHSYRTLKQGDKIYYQSDQKGTIEAEVVWHAGAHLMKYYKDNETFIPILPSRFASKVAQKVVVEPKEEFAIKDNQLEMTFA